MRDYAALVDQALDLVRFVDKYAGLIGADLVEFFRTSSPSSSSSTSTDANGDEGIGWLSVPAAWRAEWTRDPTSPAIVSLLRSAPGSGCTADVGSLWSPEQRELPETAARLAFQRTVDFGQLEGGAAIVTLDEMFTLGMKEKKQHEVMVMAAVIDSIAKRRGIATVVDLGAGMAHLSNMLAFHYGLNVIAVDNDTKQTAGALTRQANIEKRIAAKASTVWPFLSLVPGKTKQNAHRENRGEDRRGQGQAYHGRYSCIGVERGRRGSSHRHASAHWYLITRLVSTFHKHNS